MMACLIFAIIPVGANYWAYVFPAMICGTIGIDITFSVTNIFISTSMPLKRQGLAGALINSLVQLSIAFLLGFAALIAKQLEHKGTRHGYKVIFWFSFACATVSWILLLGFVKIDKAKSDLTADERAAAALEE
jgi:MFS family permease